MNLMKQYIDRNKIGLRQRQGDLRVRKEVKDLKK